MRSPLFLSAILSCGVAVCSAAPDSVYKNVTGCTVTELGKCGTDYLPYFEGKLLAATPETQKPMCSKFQDQLSCADDFVSRCFDGIAKGALQVMIEAAREQYMNFCDETNEKYKVYFDNIECVNKAGPGLTPCVNGLYVGLHRAASKANEQPKIAYACCDYIDFKSCAKKALRSLCGSTESEEFFNEIIEKVFGEVLNLTCGKFSNELSLCDALPKLSTEDDKEALRRHFIDAIAVISGSLG